MRGCIVPNRVQIDANVGTQAGDYGANRWMFVGLRLLTSAFLK